MHVLQAKDIVVVILTMFCFLGPQPLICCPPSGPQVCPPRANQPHLRRAGKGRDLTRQLTAEKNRPVVRNKSAKQWKKDAHTRLWLRKGMFDYVEILFGSQPYHFTPKKYLFYLHTQAMIKHIWIGPLGSALAQILPIRSDLNKTLCL